MLLHTCIFAMFISYMYVIVGVLVVITVQEYILSINTVPNV